MPTPESYEQCIRCRRHSVKDGRCVECDSTPESKSVPTEQTKVVPRAESALAEQGVFKGAKGLRGLADADAFWDQQPYSTRLYYGDGIADYLHRGVLRAAVAALDATPAPVQGSGGEGGNDACEAFCRILNLYDNCYEHHDIGTTEAMDEIRKIAREQYQRLYRTTPAPVSGGEAVVAALRECELFLRVLGHDSEPARKAAESARNALAAHTPPSPGSEPLMDDMNDVVLAGLAADDPALRSPGSEGVEGAGEVWLGVDLASGPDETVECEVSASAWGAGEPIHNAADSTAADAGHVKGSEGVGEAVAWSLPEAEALVAFFGGSNAAVSVQELPADTYDDGSPRPAGKHAWCDDCPEEGITYLGPYDPDTETPEDQRLSREWMERATSGGDDGFTADGAGEQAGEVELPPLPEAADELAEADGFNVIGLAPVFTAEQMRAYAASTLAQARAECERLERLVYVPGMTKCAKCGFAQISTTLHVNDGRMSANNEPVQCPNGCGPLWRVTERDAGNEMVDRCEALQTEATRLREGLREARRVVGILKTLLWGSTVPNGDGADGETYRLVLALDARIDTLLKGSKG